MQLSQIPILSILTYVPLVGALALVFLFPKEKTGPIKAFATLVAGLDFVISVPLWFAFQRGKPGYQFEELASWCVRENPLPAGSVLLTGTGIVPPDDVALAPGYRVEVEVEGIGVLSNPVRAA